FRRRSSRLRKNRPHNASPVFDNRTSRRSAQEPRSSTAQGRRHAPCLVQAHVPTLVAAQRRRNGIAKSLNSLIAHVDSADSVDSNSLAPGGKKLLAAAGDLTLLPAACCLLPAPVDAPAPSATV